MKALSLRVSTAPLLVLTSFGAGTFVTRAARAAAHTEVSGGAAHTCARKADGTLWCWGKNARGQVGDGTITSRLVPTLVPLAASIVEVSARGDHSCARSDHGALFCWGSNDNGMLGDGTTVDRHAPVPVTGLGAGAAQVAAGAYHTCARKSDGTVWCWGWNAVSQLGTGVAGGESATPVQVTSLGNSVVELTAGDYHTCARKSDGSLWCWGYNILGQLGDGTTNDRATPTQIIASPDVVREVTAGAQHTCARLSNNSLWCWGADESGQIGKGDVISRQNPVPVLTTVLGAAAGGHHTCAFRTDQTYWCWGQRDHGQLGDGVIGAPQLTPELVPLQTASSVLEITGGELHTCTHHADGTLYCAGRGADGEVGDGTTVDRAVPVLVLRDLSASGITRAPAAPGPWSALLALALAGTAVTRLRRRPR